MNKDGTLKSNSDLQESELKLYCAILAFVAARVQNVGRNSGVGFFKNMSVTFTDKILLVYEREPDVIGIFVNQQVNLKTLEPMVLKEIQNYLNERR